MNKVTVIVTKDNYYSVGDPLIDSIIEHVPINDNDRWFYDIHYDDGFVVREYEPVKVGFYEEGVVPEDSGRQNTLDNWLTYISSPLDNYTIPFLKKYLAEEDTIKVPNELIEIVKRVVEYYEEEAMR